MVLGYKCMKRGMGDEGSGVACKRDNEETVCVEANVAEERV